MSEGNEVRGRCLYLSSQLISVLYKDIKGYKERLLNITKNNVRYKPLVCVVFCRLKKPGIAQIFARVFYVYFVFIILNKPSL